MGRRVQLDAADVPRDRNGAGFTVDAWARLDGWSPAAALLAVFPNVSLAASAVPGWQDMARSLEDDCPTVLLDALTGERVAHFAELDASNPVRARAQRPGGAREG